MLSRFLAAALALVLCACSVNLAPAGTPVATSRYNGADFQLEHPARWVLQAGGTGYGVQATFSSADYRNFKLTLIKRPVEDADAEYSLAELCSIQDQAYEEVKAGSLKKKDFTLDGKLACYGEFASGDTELHVLTTVANGALYIVMFQFTFYASLDTTRDRVLADMNRLFASWRWQTPTPKPSPTADGFQAALANYFPLNEGWRWEYEVLERGRYVGRLSVTAKDVSDDAAGRPSGKLERNMRREAEGETTSEQAETWTVSQSLYGVKLTDAAGQALDILKAPLSPAREWESQGHKFRVVGREDLLIPFGTFLDALQVEETWPTGETASHWYSTDFGLVKSRIKAANGDVTERTLVEFVAP